MKGPRPAAEVLAPPLQPSRAARLPLGGKARVKDVRVGFATSFLPPVLFANPPAPAVRKKFHVPQVTGSTALRVPSCDVRVGEMV